MTNSPDYNPPTSASIKSRQNEAVALRLLIAQRATYNKAKLWQSLRWSGLLLIGLAAPTVSVIWPGLAVLMGAIAGLWLFLGRTFISWRVRTLAEQGAALQEAFDQYAFDMPRSISRSSLPSVEDIATLAGPDRRLLNTAESEDLIDWYPVDESTEGSVAVAIAQRANVSYSNRLMRTTLLVWGSTSVAWLAMLAAAGMFAGLSATTFMVGVVLPLLPAALDVVEYLGSIRKAATDRGDLARSIQGRIEQAGGTDPHDLLVWQGEMYELRRSTPQVPNWLYGISRGRNESAMHTAARLLAERSRNPHLPGGGGGEAATRADRGRRCEVARWMAAF